MNHHLITTVSIRGDVLVPLLDSETNGAPMIHIGPGYERSNFRLYCRMPDKHSAKSMPSPMGHDPTTLTFDVERIVLIGPPPMNAHIHLYRLEGAGGAGRVDKDPVHTWSTHRTTGLHASIGVSLKTLKPDDWMAIEGISRFYKPRSTGSKKGSPWMTTPHRMPRPEQRHPLRLDLYALCRARYLPARPPGSSVRVVSGDLFSQPMPAQGFVPEPMGDLEASMNDMDLDKRGPGREDEEA